MSERHVRRLDSIRDEFIATSETLGHCLASYDGLRLRVDLRDIERAIDRLPDTYIVRLTAEVEGMLYRHLLRFPAGALGRVVITPKTEASVLVDLAGVSPKLGSSQEMLKRRRDEARTVFDYRNSVAHGGKTPRTTISFATAHARLVEFVRRLEDATDV